MGIFDGINNAPTWEKGRKLPDGSDNLIRIERCLLQKSQQQKGADIFIVEFVVEESNKAEVGGRYSWTQFMTDQNVAFPALKGFVLAIFGVNKERDPIQYAAVEKQVDTVLEAAVSAGYLNGQKVRVQANQKRTGNNRDFLAHSFRAV